MQENIESAAEIAARRFARGEIGSEEYQTLLAALRDAGASGTRKQTNSSLFEKINDLQAPGKNTPSLKFFQAAGLGALGFIIFISILRSFSDQGALHIRNVSSSGLWGDIIYGEVLNEGPSGNVFVWIEVQGKVYCPRATYLQRNERQQFKIPCYEMAGLSGTFHVQASRKPSATVRNNALSL